MTRKVPERTNRPPGATGGSPRATGASPASAEPKVPRPTGFGSAQGTSPASAKGSANGATGGSSASAGGQAPSRGTRTARPSALLDTRIIYCGDCLDQFRKLPDACIDLIYIDPPACPGHATRRESTASDPHPSRVSRVNSNRNDEVFWDTLSEPRPSGSGCFYKLEDRHASTQAYIDYTRPRCVELARVLKKTSRPCLLHRQRRCGRADGFSPDA